MIEKLVSEYLNTLKSESTKINYGVALKDFLIYFKNFSDIQTQKIKDYQQQLLTKKAKQTVNARMAAIRSFLDYCWTKGIIGTNPALIIKNNIIKKYKYSKNISVQDFKKILQQTSLTLKGLRDSLLFRLIFYYGDIQRVLSFKWDQPMPSPKLARLKNKLELSVQKYMNRIYKNDPYLFQHYLDQFKKGFLFFSFEKNTPQTAQAITAAGVRKLLQQYCLNAGLNENHIDFRALKKLRAKEIYKKTKSIEQVQRFCGHKDIQITKEYIKRGFK